MKIGRNDPCTCGSGKKFKNCCENIIKAISKMGEHERRMLAISRYAGPPPGSKEYEKYINFLEDNVEAGTYKDDIKKLFSLALIKVKTYLSNGAGLICDQNLRYFFQETNDRLFNTGLWSFPTSFNIVEAFLNYNHKLNCFEIREEKDFTFSFNHFMDFATSDKCIDNLNEAIEYLKDDLIYNFNNSDELKFLTLKNEHNKEYALAGMSIIKHDDELNIIMTIGEITDTRIMDETIREQYKTAQFYDNPAKKDLKPAEDRAIEAVRLCGIEGIWQNIVLTRFDLTKRTQHVRYILKDMGQSFRVFNDDPSIFPKHYSNFVENKDELVSNMLEELNANSVLFELTKIAIYLPYYFEVNNDDIIIERHPTELKNALTPSEIKHQVELKNKILYRDVSVLKNANYLSPDIRSLKAPELKIETTGFWKQLAHGERGTDKNGNPIFGKTWVEKQLSWVESKSEDTLKIYKKKNPQTIADNDSGYIYVMRSAAHSKDIFKIGVTRRSSEIRSDELSRTTGSPDKFLVVEEWLVNNCLVAEREIHERIEKYRINPSREFFKAPYSLLREEIAEVIKKYSTME